MARNWANFLNEASRGYGLGFQRYQDFEAAQDARRRRALMTDAMDSLQEAERAIDPEFGEAVPGMPGYRKQAPRQMAGPATTPAQVSALPTDTVPIGAPGTEDQFQPIRVGAPAQPSVAAKYTQNPLAPAPVESDSTAPPLRPGATPATNALAVAQGEAKRRAAELDAALPEVNPRHGRIEMTEPTTSKRKLSAQGVSRADAYARAKNKLREAYVMDGNVEGLLSLDERFAEMQRTKMLNHMSEAQRLYSVDPAAAAKELYRAYSYLPDGSDVDIRMDQDGTLYAMGYDEETGDFRGGMKLDSQALSNLYRHYEDPAKFQQDMEALRLEREQQQYERGQDKIANWIEEEKLLHSAYELALERAKAGPEAQYWLARAAALAGAPTDADPRDLEDIRKLSNDIIGRMDAWRDVDDAPESFRLLTDRSTPYPVSPSIIGRIATRMVAANHHFQHSADDSMIQASVIAFMDRLAQGKVQGAEAQMDRRLRKQYQTLLEENEVYLNGYAPEANMIVLEVNGQEMVLEADLVRGLKNIAMKMGTEDDPRRVSALDLLPEAAPLLSTGEKLGALDLDLSRVN